MRELSPLSDFGLGWLEGSGPHSGIVLSTRVRLARNLQGHAFNTRTRDGEREQIYERVRQASETTAALAALPAAQREVFLAHEVEGLSFKEIAARTGVGVNTLLSRKHKAVLQLRRRLRGVYDEFLTR